MQWDASSGNATRRKWRAFPPKVQPLIDAAFRRQKGRGAIDVTIQDQHYRLYFDEMKQQNRTTLFCRGLRWVKCPESDGATAAPDAGKMLPPIEDTQHKRKWSDLSEGLETTWSATRERVCIRCGCFEDWEGLTEECCGRNGAGMCIFDPVARTASEVRDCREDDRAWRA